MSKYTEKKEIGKGNFGVAYVVNKGGIDIILKEMNLSKLTSPKDRKNVKAEVETIQKLNNRYIVHYIDSYFEKEFIYIEMEYCKYGDLEKLILYITKNGNHLSEEGVMKYFVDVLLGLKYLHDKNICHRDLKPANIFITFDGACAIGDFGLSKFVEPDIALQSLAGTPLYMAPEMLTNNRNYGIEVDIWALGCILHELCSKITAFSGKNLMELIQNVHLKPSQPIPSFYSNHLSNLIDKMLIKQPEKRPTINDLLADPYIQQYINNIGPWVLYKYQTVRCQTGATVEGPPPNYNSNNGIRFNSNSGFRFNSNSGGTSSNSNNNPSLTTSYAFPTPKVKSITIRVPGTVASKTSFNPEKIMSKSLYFKFLSGKIKNYHGLTVNDIYSKIQANLDEIPNFYCDFCIIFPSPYESQLYPNLAPLSNDEIKVLQGPKCADIKAAAYSFFKLIQKYIGYHLGQNSKKEPVVSRIDNFTTHLENWTDKLEIYLVITRIFEYFCVLGHEYEAIHKAYVIRLFYDMTNDYKKYFEGKSGYLVKWIKMLSDPKTVEAFLKLCVKNGIQVE